MRTKQSFSARAAYNSSKRSLTYLVEPTRGDARAIDVGTVEEVNARHFVVRRTVKLSAVGFEEFAHGGVGLETTRVRLVRRRVVREINLPSADEEGVETHSTTREVLEQAFGHAGPVRVEKIVHDDDAAGRQITRHRAQVSKR